MHSPRADAPSATPPRRQPRRPGRRRRRQHRRQHRRLYSSRSSVSWSLCRGGSRVSYVSWAPSATPSGRRLQATTSASCASPRQHSPSSTIRVQLPSTTQGGSLASRQTAPGPIQVVPAPSFLAPSFLAPSFLAPFSRPHLYCHNACFFTLHTPAVFLFCSISTGGHSYTFLPIRRPFCRPFCRHVCTTATFSESHASQSSPRLLSRHLF